MAAAQASLYNRGDMPSFPANPFQSRLWIDQPDAPERIADRVHSGEISVDDATLLSDFRRDGYVRLFLDPAVERFDALLRDIEQLWIDKTG